MPLQPPSKVRQAIIDESLSWVGTPYHAQAHLKGIGVDCIGLIIGVAKAVGVLAPTYRPPIYSQEWHWHSNEELLQETLTLMQCPCLPVGQHQPGDMLVFQYGRVSSHVGIVLPEGLLVHAVRDDGRVVAQRLTEALQGRLRAAYAFPGVL